MDQYLKGRFTLFNAWSKFSCPDSCGRNGCKESNLHISISLVDLVAISSISGHKASDLFKHDLKIGFDPLSEKEPWIGRINIELKKPCHFLNGKECSVYPGRPIACALFPESCFMGENPAILLKKDIFRNFPCIQNPCFISPQRREALYQLLEMSIKEFFLSDFYLFGISPFVLDLKIIAGEILEGIHISKEGKAKILYPRIEGLIFQRLCEVGYWDDWATKIEQLDRADGLNRLEVMKSWTDQTVKAVKESQLSIIYQFDGSRLLPIRLRKKFL
jgi:Fe-S-cluster containining protein